MEAISPKVIAVVPLDNYKLSIAFENGEDRLFDVTPYLEQGIFSELKDIDYFVQVAVSFDAIEWPHGQDFSRDTLYLKGI